MMRGHGHGMEYRARVYERYASAIKGFTPQFDPLVAERWAAAFRHYLRGWLPQDRNARIADLACGDGRLLYLLRGAGYAAVVGVDISPEQTALARQVHDHVTQADVLEFLGDKEGQFDVVFGLDILEHLCKDEALRFLDLAHRSLAPQGRLVLSTPNAASPLGASRRYGDFTHEIAFSPACLAGVLRLAGFDEIESREMGPYPHGVLSAVRFVLWRLLRLLVVFYNYVEIGHRGDGPCTRDFLVSAVKRSSSPSEMRR